MLAGMVGFLSVVVWVKTIGRGIQALRAGEDAAAQHKATKCHATSIREKPT
jgi:hypothetical protein